MAQKFRFEGTKVRSKFSYDKKSIQEMAR